MGQSPEEQRAWRNDRETFVPPETTDSSQGGTPGGGESLRKASEKTRSRLPITAEETRTRVWSDLGVACGSGCPQSGCLAGDSTALANPGGISRWRPFGDWSRLLQMPS
jgi:hypothetical protein